MSRLQRRSLFSAERPSVRQAPVQANRGVTQRSMPPPTPSADAGSSLSSRHRSRRSACASLQYLPTQTISAPDERCHRFAHVCTSLSSSAPCKFLCASDDFALKCASRTTFVLKGCNFPAGAAVVLKSCEFPAGRDHAITRAVARTASQLPRTSSPAAKVTVY